MIDSFPTSKNLENTINQKELKENEEKWHTGPSTSNTSTNYHQRQYASKYHSPNQYHQEAYNKKILAGVLAIILGHIGIHKFVLGYTTEGILLLVLGLTGYITTCMFIGYYMLLIAFIIGLVEGIIYLTHTDNDFYETYILNKKPWF
ncbi:TM2 domain-containing protein [Paenimyroides aestuarii]|uniref:TM2 domain-containing protein n=1 Tax=Paenimyroides aestuarii TaxID=2968490 RepID=UPI0037C99580